MTGLTQLTCFEDTEGAQLIDEATHDRLVELAGGAGWAYVDGAWVGERPSSLSAYGSWEVLQESDESALIVRLAGHYPQAVYLRTFTRAGSPPVTVKDFEMHVCGDPTWQSPTHPASAMAAGGGFVGAAVASGVGASDVVVGATDGGRLPSTLQ